VAAASSARNKAAGNSRPRFSARRRIPRQAVGLKKYLGGTSPGSVSTSDNEHTAATLGDSEPLSVKNAVGGPIPQFCQRPENGSHVGAVARRQKAGDVFEKNPAGSDTLNDSHGVEEQPASLASQSSTLASHTEVLAGESATDELASHSVRCVVGLHVVMPRRFGEVNREHFAGPCGLFDLCDGANPGPL
jgi:hypothetical protein